MREFQIWMYDAITSHDWPEDTSCLVDPERLAIYRDMYPMRMYDALVSDYPAIAAFLGDEKFADLVHHYSEIHPSQSYTLNRLGDSFPEFLKDDPFLYDLARFELAMTQVFDEEETPALNAEAVASIGPDSRLKPIAAFRLLSFDYPVAGFFQSFRDEEELVEPEPRTTYVAFHRRDYSVYRMPLEKKAYDFLSALCGGSTLVEAIDATGPTQDELFAWFREWSAAGIFGGIE